MQLDILKSYNAQLFTPYTILDRRYHIIFYRQGVVGPFFVRDSPLVLNTMFYIGEIAQGSLEGAVAGAIFYTQLPSMCEGSFILAYSGLLKQGANSPRAKARDLGFELVLKEEHYYVFHKKNLATLVVNPSLKFDIRRNLEV